MASELRTPLFAAETFLSWGTQRSPGGGSMVFLQRHPEASCTEGFAGALLIVASYCTAPDMSPYSDGECIGSLGPHQYLALKMGRD